MATNLPTQPPYKAGEIVQFKTGVLKMVVISCTTEKANCIYYNTVTGKFETKDLPLVTIKRYVAPA
jgi:hypothetical protein